jgi:hypothetical protein
MSAAPRASSLAQATGSGLAWRSWPHPPPWVRPSHHDGAGADLTRQDADHRYAADDDRHPDPWAWVAPQPRDARADRCAVDDRHAVDHRHAVDDRHGADHHHAVDDRHGADHHHAADRQDLVPGRLRLGHLWDAGRGCRNEVDEDDRAALGAWDPQGRDRLGALLGRGSTSNPRHPWPSLREACRCRGPWR